MPGRNPTNKNFEPPSADAQRIEEIRKTISECVENARQACNDKKRTYEYDRLYDFLRAELYQAKKLRHLADAAILKEENPQRAELHFRKAVGKSGLDWIEKTKLLAAHKIFTDRYDRSYPEAARIIIDIRPAVAKLANEKQIVQLRKHFEHLRPKGFVEWRRPKGLVGPLRDFVGPLLPLPLSLAAITWQCIWEDAPRNWHPIDFAYYLILLIKLPG
jgi:hypothetical protein